MSKVPKYTVGTVLAAIPIVLLVFGVVTAFMGWVFMLLWNFAVVPTFAAPELAFAQAWALWVILVLVSSMFRKANSKG